jgi:superfamily I DNA/RNA helicase
LSALSAAATAAAGPEGDEDKLVTISNRIENLGILLDMADREASMALAAREQQLDFDSSGSYSDVESDVEYNYVGGDAVEPVQQQPLRHFLDWIGRETDRDNSKSEPKVRLTTIHAAKGQEADCVMVIGCPMMASCRFSFRVERLIWSRSATCCKWPLHVPGTACALSS